MSSKQILAFKVYMIDDQ